MVTCGPVDIGDATEKSPRDALKRASVPAMAASRTIGEQDALERVVSGRGKAMDFSSGSEVGGEDVTAPLDKGADKGAAPARKGRTSKTVDPRAHGVTTDSRATPS